MGKIIRNGIEYSGTYDSADSVNYDNSNSGLNARTVQEGIDELNDSLKNFLHVEVFSGLKITAASGASSNNYFDVSVDGYEAIGILAYGISGSGFANVGISVLRIDDGNTLYVRASDGTSSTNFEASILYIKKKQNDI